MSYVRVSILGSITGGEKWSINPVFDPTGEFPGGVNQANLDAAANAIALLALPAGLQTLMSSALYVTGARLEVRDDGNDSLIALSEKIYSPGTPGGSNAAVMPAQAAIVVSCRTDTPGASGRGRLYWPALGATLSGALRLQTPSPAGLATDFKTYFLAMRSALATNFPTIGFDLAVRSKTTHTTPHVTRLQIGNTIDTQRRRRDHLPETYTSVSFP